MKYSSRLRRISGLDVLSLDLRPPRVGVVEPVFVVVGVGVVALDVVVGLRGGRLVQNSVNCGKGFRQRGSLKIDR